MDQDERLDRLGRRQLYRLVGVQGMLSAALSLLGYLVSSDIALSVLLGGSIATLPSALMLVFVTRSRGQAKQVVTAFYRGQVAKFCVTLLLFFLAFNYVSLLKQPTNALVLFMAFVAVQSTLWLAPIVLSRRQNKR